MSQSIRRPGHSVDGAALTSIVRFWISFSFKPQQRLRDGDVAFDFPIGWISGKLFPKFEILWFVQRLSCKEQTRLPRGPTFPRLNVRFARPFGFVREKRIQKVHRLPHAAAVWQRVKPKILPV